MNKTLAEILAAPIPHKLTRNRWRGLLRFGPLKAWRLKKQMALDNSRPGINIAVCAIMKNEAPYLEEWLQWHIGQGVEKFYLYDNESTDATKTVLQPYIDKGIVEYHWWPGRKMQLPAYDDCFRRHRLDTSWLAVIDLDEFIVPVGNFTLKEFLSDKEDAAAVEINWLVYGSGGARTREPGPVMKRFRRHSLADAIVNRHVKSIVNPRKVCGMTGCHEATRLTGSTVDSHGRIVKQSFRERQPQHDTIKINHYAVKSYEEFLNKRARGRARTLDMRGMDYFERYDLNDIAEE